MVDRVCVVSVPKSGTNLMIKVLMLLGFEPLIGLMPRRVSFATKRAGEGRLKLGLSRDSWVPTAEIERFLHEMPVPSATATHAPWSPGLADLFRAHSVVPVLIVRDPRDVAVSQAHWWVADRAGHRGRPAYQPMSPTERIFLAATGGRVNGRSTLSVGDRLDRLLPWRDRAGAVTARFEDFVGPDAPRAVAELAASLGVGISDRRAHQVARMIPGQTSTYRRGVVGGWRDDVPTDRHEDFERILAPEVEHLGYA